MGQHNKYIMPPKTWNRQFQSIIFLFECQKQVSMFALKVTTYHINQEKEKTSTIGFYEDLKVQIEPIHIQTKRCLPRVLSTAITSKVVSFLRVATHTVQKYLGMVCILKFQSNQCHDHPSFLQLKTRYSIDAGSPDLKSSLASLDQYMHAFYEESSF